MLCNEVNQLHHHAVTLNCPLTSSWSSIHRALQARYIQVSPWTWFVANLHTGASIIHFAMTWEDPCSISLATSLHLPLWQRSHFLVQPSHSPVVAPSTKGEILKSDTTGIEQQATHGTAHHPHWGLKPLENREVVERHRKPNYVRWRGALSIVETLCHSCGVSTPDSSSVQCSLFLPSRNSEDEIHRLWRCIVYRAGRESCPPPMGGC